SSPAYHTDRCLLQRYVQSHIAFHCCSPSLRGHMRMASCVPGELIPCAFVWHDPGITPCCKSPKLPRDDFLAVRRSDPTNVGLCSLTHVTEVARKFIGRR